MFGALAWDVIFIVVGVMLLFKVTGYDFMVAVNSATSGYLVPTGPWYHFLAALVYNAPILTFLIVGSFLFWSLPAMVGNTYMPIRSWFAWSFDRLLPEKLSEVNERTHSPVWAILFEMVLVTVMLIWSIISTTFGTWLALGVLGACVTNRQPEPRQSARIWYAHQDFRPYDQDSLLLMPPSLRDWVKPDGLAAFISDLVDTLDLAPFLAAHDDPRACRPITRQ